MSDAPRDPRRPAVLHLEPEKEPKRETAEKVKARREARSFEPASVTIDETDPFGTEAQASAAADDLTPPPAQPRKRRFSFARLAAGAFGILVSLAVALWTDRLVRDLFERSDWLGWTALAAAGIFLLAVTLAVLREVLAILRLSEVQKLKDEADKATTKRNSDKAGAVVSRLVALTRDKPRTARGRRAIAEMDGEIVDAPQLIAFAERELLAPLDIEARRLIFSASRRVSLVTAVSPRAVVDLAYVLYESTRLVRAMATLYGARPGTFGLIRLLRDVIAHLAVTTSIAVGDSMIQQVIGHGVASRLSSRLGEGVVNGLMTARIGIAAMDLCRPLPFRAVARPGIGDFMSDLTGTLDPDRNTGKTASREPDRR